MGLTDYRLRVIKVGKEVTIDLYKQIKNDTEEYVSTWMGTVEMIPAGLKEIAK